ncbi:cytochrome b561 [Desulfuromonas soudanensis]|uniref:Cytochrome b561 n=1 Tax=Desulfuromonas soudanensis TaxID=1603606 RepID=A0A0M5IVZ3_9BACT|nr:VTT domain-containing protein [Desulfuromonas soudanensis]ALC16724.1 cytochrome b561 [Desulfuromonas soudanensis]
MWVIRRLYDWVLHWANTPYGAPALFLLAVAESSFFPIPPDVLLLALCISVPARSFRFALLASVGSVLGGILGYGIGLWLWEGLASYFYNYVPGFTEQVFASVQNLFSTYDFWTVFAAGFTPIPYKVITIGAGVFQINFPVFVLASAISRSLRFFLVAWLIYRYGTTMRGFVEKYFNLLSILFVVLLIGGFVVIRHFLH